VPVPDSGGSQADAGRVRASRRSPGPDRRQIQYRRHPAAIFNRTLKPLKESAVELMAARLKERPGEVTLLCIGPLTNAAC
jgi:inosine-uridine nucleoside N-ribohydrolase